MKNTNLKIYKVNEIVMQDYGYIHYENCHFWDTYIWLFILE